MKYLFSGDIQYVSGRKKKRKIGKKLLLAVLLIAFLLFSIGSFLMIADTFEQMFARAEKPEFTYYQTYIDVADDYRRTEIEFMSEQNKLRGYIYGSKNADKLVVLSHGMGGGAESYLAETMYFVDHGYRVFAFDNTGSYNSEGDGIGGLSQSVIDLDSALQYIEQDEELAELPVFLYGHSWGGYAVTAILNYDHIIDGVVSVAGYNTPMEMITDWCKDEMGFFTYIEYPYLWLYQKYLFGGTSNLSAVKGINNTDTPVMVIHGRMDQVVPFDSAAIIAHQDQVTNPNAVFKICSEEGQNGHSNLFGSKESAQYVAELDAQYKELEREYQGEIPQDVLKSWRDGIDKEKASELDEVFMRDVIDFMEQAAEAASQSGK